MKKLIVMLLSLGLFISCTHDNEITPGDDGNPPQIIRGDDQVSITGDWTFDQNHSNVRWETEYFGVAALLTGRFNEFNVEVFEFDEDNPENIQIKGTVVLSTVNTGEPGRDSGCLQETLGTATSDEAILESTSVEFSPFDAGYIVTANLTFHGVTDEITMKLNYVGTTFLEDRSFFLAGFQGEFDFFAKSIFGIESSSINDKVTVKLNIQFRQAI